MWLTSPWSPRGCRTCSTARSSNFATPRSAPTVRSSRSGLQWDRRRLRPTFAVGPSPAGRLRDIERPPPPLPRRRPAASRRCGAVRLAQARSADRFRRSHGARFAAMRSRRVSCYRQPAPRNELQKAFGLSAPLSSLSAWLGPVSAACHRRRSTGGRSSGSPAARIAALLGSRKPPSRVARGTTRRRATSRPPRSFHPRRRLSSTR